MSLNIPLIRESFSAVKQHALPFTEHFYGELFQKYPQARGLFSSTNMQNQQKALANGLAHIVEYLEEPEHLMDYLQKMGERHVAYGTKEEHYAWVGDALLSTFEYFFEAQWTDELRENWKTAFGFITEQMCIGMKKAQDNKVRPLKRVEGNPKSLQDFARAISFELLKKALKEETERPEFQDQIRKKAKKLLEDAIEQEAKAFLNASLPQAKTG